MADSSDLELELVIPEGNPYSGTYLWRLADCTGLDDLAVKRETGFTLLGLAELALRSDVGMSLVFAAVIVWLDRQKNGFTHNTFAEIASRIPWSANVDLHDPKPSSNTDDESGKAESEVTSATSDSPVRSLPSTASDRGNSTSSHTESATA